MKIAEILAELSLLSRDDLISIAAQVDQTLRDQDAIIYDDIYGVFTEADPIALAVQGYQ